jgi:hypothetical protein
MAARRQEEIALRLHSANFLQDFLEFDEISDHVLFHQPNDLIVSVLGDAADRAVCALQCKVRSFLYKAVHGRSLPTAVIVPRTEGVMCAVITLIIISKSRAFFLCRMHPVVERVGCFCLAPSTSVELIPQDGAKHPQPLHVYENNFIGGDGCVVPAYDIDE